MDSVFEKQLTDKGISLDFKEHIANRVWIDGGANIHDIGFMKNDHILECIKFLEKGNYTNSRDKIIPLPEILGNIKEEYIELFEQEATIRYAASCMK